MLGKVTVVDQLIEAKEMAVRIVATGCNRTMCKGFKKGSFSTQVMYLPCRCILDFMSVFVKFGIQRERAQWVQ